MASPGNSGTTAFGAGARAGSRTTSCCDRRCTVPPGCPTPPMLVATPPCTLTAGPGSSVQGGGGGGGVSGLALGSVGPAAWRAAVRLRSDVRSAGISAAGDRVCHRTRTGVLTATTVWGCRHSPRCRRRRPCAARRSCRTRTAATGASGRRAATQLCCHPHSRGGRSAGLQASASILEQTCPIAGRLTGRSAG